MCSRIRTSSARSRLAKRLADAKFTPIENEKIIERYLRYMEDLNAPVLCAVRETGIRFETTAIRIVDDRIVHLRMKNDVISPEALRKSVMATNSQRVDISYHAHDILIFASTKLNKAHKDGISLEVERPIYKLQRREHLRVKPGTDIDCLATLSFVEEKRHEEHAPYDLSGGGFSILVSQDAAVRFMVGMQFRNVSFRFGPHEVLLQAVVKNKVPIRGPRKVNIKIGFNVTDMPVALEREITRYAYLSTQKILGRRI